MAGILLSCYVSDRTRLRLQHAADDRGDSIEFLAETAIEETALRYAQTLTVDPADEAASGETTDA